MESFSQKYPAFAALLVLVATVGQDAAAPATSVAAKFEDFVNLVGPALAFLPESNLLGAEISQLKGSAADIEAAAEALVTDLSFSSGKAQTIIKAAFPLAEAIVAGIPLAEAVIAAVKA